MAADDFDPQQKFPILRNKGPQANRPAGHGGGMVGVEVISGGLSVQTAPEDAIVGALSGVEGDSTGLIVADRDLEFHEIARLGRLHEELSAAAPLAFSQAGILNADLQAVRLGNHGQGLALDGPSDLKISRLGIGNYGILVEGAGGLPWLRSCPYGALLRYGS